MHLPRVYAIPSLSDPDKTIAWVKFPLPTCDRLLTDLIFWLGKYAVELQFLVLCALLVAEMFFKIGYLFIYYSYTISYFVNYNCCYMKVQPLMYAAWSVRFTIYVVLLISEGGYFTIGFRPEIDN